MFPNALFPRQFRSREEGRIIREKNVFNNVLETAINEY